MIAVRGSEFCGQMAGRERNSNGVGGEIQNLRRERGNSFEDLVT